MKRTGLQKQLRAGVVVGSVQQLAMIRRIVDELGLEIVHMPGTPPEVLDYLGVGLASGLDGAMLGGILIGVLGLLLGAPREVVVIGLAAGGALGALHGIDKVQQGWRVRVQLKNGVLAIGPA